MKRTFSNLFRFTAIGAVIALALVLSACEQDQDWIAIFVNESRYDIQVITDGDPDSFDLPALANVSASASTQTVRKHGKDGIYYEWTITSAGGDRDNLVEAKEQGGTLTFRNAEGGLAENEVASDEGLGK